MQYAFLFLAFSTRSEVFISQYSRSISVLFLYLCKYNILTIIWRLNPGPCTCQATATELRLKCGDCWHALWTLKVYYKLPTEVEPLMKRAILPSPRHLNYCKMQSLSSLYFPFQVPTTPKYDQMPTGMFRIVWPRTSIQFSILCSFSHTTV